MFLHFILCVTEKNIQCFGKDLKDEKLHCGKENSNSKIQSTDQTLPDNQITSMFT